MEAGFDTFVDGDINAIDGVINWICDDYLVAIEGALDKLYSVRNKAQSAWEGTAADQFLNKINELINLCKDVRSQANKAWGSIIPFRDTLKSTKLTNEEILQEAAAAGLTVAGTEVFNIVCTGDEDNEVKQKSYQNLYNSCKDSFNRLIEQGLDSFQTEVDNIISLVNAENVSTLLSFAEISLDAGKAYYKTYGAILKSKSEKLFSKADALNSKISKWDNNFKNKWLDLVFGDLKKKINDIRINRAETKIHNLRIKGRAANVKAFKLDNIGNKLESIGKKAGWVDVGVRVATADTVKDAGKEASKGVFELSAATLGAEAGAALGTMVAGPVGTAVGGVIGGLFAGFAAEWADNTEIGDKVTDKIGEGTDAVWKKVKD